ncbi:MAG: gliding motility-associated peptidyl-prolyl isomerase GldI [Bacteroidota bacterium]
MKPYSYFALLLVFLGCGEPEPRRPVKVNSGRFYNESVARNKALLEKEEKYIQDLIALDTKNEYFQSANGSWYYYGRKNVEADYTPQPDDLVTLTYNILSLENDTLYSSLEIGPIRYKVDKQELFPGLRNSVKLLKENETATFLFPSSLGYGYHGDNNKIGINVPIKSTISILDIQRKEKIE